MEEKVQENTDDKNSVGLGVDIVDISKMREVIERTPNFIEKTFTEDEIKYCKKSSRFVEHFATHFAAKEAVLKALGLGIYEGGSLKDIEVCHNEKGKPFVKLNGKVLEISKEAKIKDFPISLSFTNTEAVGFAIALTEKSALQNKVLEKSKDPVAELTKQFKEAKKILDEQN